jgi:hypothetical protein
MYRFFGKVQCEFRHENTAGNDVPDSFTKVNGRENNYILRFLLLIALPFIWRNPALSIGLFFQLLHDLIEVPWQEFKSDTLPESGPLHLLFLDKLSGKNLPRLNKFCFPLLKRLLDSFSKFATVKVLLS